MGGRRAFPILRAECDSHDRDRGRRAVATRRRAAAPKDRRPSRGLPMERLLCRRRHFAVWRGEQRSLHLFPILTMRNPDASRLLLRIACFVPLAAAPLLTN